MADYSKNKDVMDTFFMDCRENIDAMENGLLEIEKGDYDDEVINSIFRAAHTIKGSSGMFSFDIIEKFTHKVENLLDNVRNKKIDIDSDMVSLLLECNDHIINLLDIVENTGECKIEGDLPVIQEDLINRLNKFLPQDETEKKKAPKDKKNKTTPTETDDDSMSVRNVCWHISLRFGENTFKNGMDPGSFINYLEKFGEIINIKTIPDSLPGFKEYDPKNCYLGFEIDLKGETTKEELEDVFEFVQDDCFIRIIPPKSSINEYIKLINELPEVDNRIGEFLKEIGTLTDHELVEVLNLQRKEFETEGEESGRQIGEIAVEEKMVHKSVLDVALAKQKVIRKKQSSMRIDPEKLDILINLVGELVITGANVKQLSEADDIDKSYLTQSVSVMNRLIEEIRDSTMSIRMVQIGNTFKKFERVVRDLSRESNKEVDLIIEGGETELDKTLIEKIADPLMHLVRNSVDHGIDLPEERIARGKPGMGRINLNAHHETGNIVIEINDDGEGLNRDKIFAKAVDLGLINPDQDISDQELFQFIFDAGFSTAEKVTSVSGRGVGMDVVRRNIESLRGTIILDSEEGKGTSVKIHLPLTLSIIDGFMVKVGESFYVIPLDIVFECIERTSEELNAKDGGNYINLRGEVLPFMRLRDFFEEESGEPDMANIIVVRYKGGMAGLVVDRLIGELQTVIKPLGPVFNKQKWISGTTILGTGEVAIILDIPNLIKGIMYLEQKEVKQVEDVPDTVLE